MLMLHRDNYMKRTKRHNVNSLAKRRVTKRFCDTFSFCMKNREIESSFREIYVYILAHARPFRRY